MLCSAFIRLGVAGKFRQILNRRRKNEQSEAVYYMMASSDLRDHCQLCARADSGVDGNGCCLRLCSSCADQQGYISCSVCDTEACVICIEQEGRLFRCICGRWVCNDCEQHVCRRCRSLCCEGCGPLCVSCQEAASTASDESDASDASGSIDTDSHAADPCCEADAWRPDEASDHRHRVYVVAHRGLLLWRKEVSSVCLVQRVVTDELAAIQVCNAHNKQLSAGVLLKVAEVLTGFRGIARLLYPHYLQRDGFLRSLLGVHLAEPDSASRRLALRELWTGEDMQCPDVQVYRYSTRKLEGSTLHLEESVSDPREQASSLCIPCGVQTVRLADIEVTITTLCLTWLDPSPASTVQALLEFCDCARITATTDDLRDYEVFRRLAALQ